MRNLLTRTASGIVYVALMVAAVFTPWVAVPLAFFLTLVGVRELYKMYETPELKQAYPFTNIAAGMVLLAFLNLSVQYFAVSMARALPHTGEPSSSFIGFYLMILIAIVSIFLPALFCKQEHPVQMLGMGLLSIVWIVLPLCVLFFLWPSRNPAQMLSFLILIWASDTFAYLGGSLFGKHKLAPDISPGKTWEGFLISCVLTVGLAVGLSFIPFFKSWGLLWWHLVVIALLTEVFGLLGDLTESLFKRKAGVKDSGKIIPGHGGVLDRVDSILYAAIPVYLFCLMVASEA